MFIYALLGIMIDVGIMTVLIIKKINNNTMIKVEKTAKTLDEGIKNLMAGAKSDYERMSSKSSKELSGYSKEQVDNWDNKTKIITR